MKNLVFLFVIFSLFCFGGCTKNDETISNDFIMISISLGQNGEIIQSVNFVVNSEKIKEKSKNNEEYLDFIANLIKNVEKIREEYLYSIALKYLSSPNEEYKINQGVFISNVVYWSESDSVGFVIKFNSNESWNYYHQSTTGSNINQSKNVFIKRVETKTQFIFSKNYGNEKLTIGERYKNLYLSSATGLSFESEINNYSPDFVYSYSTPYQNFHSNSNIQFSKANLNFHVWKVKEGDLESENEVILWYNQINYGMWYLTVLIVVLTPTIIFLVAYNFKKRVKKK